MPTPPPSPFDAKPAILARPPAFWIMDLIQNNAAFLDGKLRELGFQDLMSSRPSNLTEAQQAKIKATMARYSTRDQVAIQGMAGDVRVYQQWAKYRDTYEPHPAMTRGLMKMKADSTVPGGVLRRLRHRNPMFLLPGAPEIIHADEQRGRIIALQVTGSVSTRYPYVGNMRLSGGAGRGLAVDTDDSEANAYQVGVVSEIHNADGTHVVDMDVLHLTVPLYGDFTVDELVSRTTGFVWTPDLLGTDDESRRRYMETAARVAVSHLLYACSRTVEIDDKPRASRPPAKPKKGEPKRVSARVYRMGWRLGAAIEDVLRRPAERRQPGPGTGKKLASHVRAAHMHMYRVGPGRQEIEFQLLAPIPVNQHLDDGKTITNHPMR
ncbi:hypothetical protein ACFPC0_10670 [Streptomyces andamanensis]|uniref:Transposase n=1 Tax=Streptomyces andamanensis TaxID=1565035 RepID=A0ABV8TCH1_9ACTN